MPFCKYEQGNVYLTFHGKQYIIHDILALDCLVQRIKNKQNRLVSKRKFDYYQGIVDLLAIARKEYLQYLEANNAQIFGG